MADDKLIELGNGEGDAYDLMPAKVLEVIPPLYAQDGKGDAAVAYVKWFNPMGAATWYITEYDPEDRTAFGWCDLGVGYPELGYVSLAEVESVRLPGGLKIERDLWFDPTPLGEIRKGAA